MAKPAKLLLVPIELDKLRNLRLDFNALSRAEVLNKKNYMVSEGFQNISITELITLVWCALLHEDRDLGIATIGAEIHPGNIAYVQECLMAAVSNSLPEHKEDEAAPLEAAASLPANVIPFPGTNSGQSEESI